MNIEEVIATIKAGPNDITLYPGAGNSLIKEFEQQMQFKLPADLKAFYQCCNGFESAEDLFRIVPLDEILERISWDKRANRMSELKSNQFYLAEYLIYCDTWTIEIDLIEMGSYKIISDVNTCVETALTHSFAEFLVRFLTGGVFDENGLYKWGEAMLLARASDALSLGLRFPDAPAAPVG
ncbi:MAG: SMI1/KNR4 family protein [Bacteroidota bacterium]|nr:SMI1/KNR4 family protein [Bacteroidota bacterium]